MKRIPQIKNFMTPFPYSISEAAPLAEAQAFMHAKRIRHVMIKEAYTVDLGTRVDTVLAYMAKHHLGSTLVTRKGKLVGVFTARDACQAFCDHLRGEFSPPGGNLVA